MSKIYGYVRVSTQGQNIDRQMTAMRLVGIDQNNIYVDKITGMVFDRPKYLKLIKKVKPGDIIYIKSIDRLGRNYSEIIEQWHYLVKTREVEMVVIDFPLLDTREKVNGVTGKFIADITLQILSYVAQIEKENIYQRQLEGIREAKKRGVKFGRPMTELPENFNEIYEKWSKGEISLRKGGEYLGVSHHTFKKWIIENKKIL